MANKILPVVEPLKDIYKKLGGEKDVDGILTTADMLKEIYAQLGGEKNIDGMTTTTELLQEIAEVAEGGGGGGLGLRIIEVELDSRYFNLVNGYVPHLFWGTPTSHFSASPQMRETLQVIASANEEQETILSLVHDDMLEISVSGDGLYYDSTYDPDTIYIKGPGTIMFANR